MKVALIYSRFKYPSGDPPLGILYIASVIKKKPDCDVTLIDTTFNPSFEYLKNHFNNNKYDFVGISTMTTQIRDSKKVAIMIKKTSPSTKVFLGGAHPSVLPEESIKYEGVDAICIGEGEVTISELIDNKLDFEGIKGLWYKKEGKIIKNPPREPIKDLDQLSFPAFEFLDMKTYLKNWFSLDAYKDNIHGTNIIASRGCPYDCSYCQPTLRTLFGKKVRRRSARNVVEEIKQLKAKYRIKGVSFVDDTFIFNKNWVHEICDLMIEEKLDIYWTCNVRANLVEQFGPSLFLKMKKAGLRKVFMGIESGSQRVLDDIYHKRNTLANIRNAVKILKKLKLIVQGYFMIGAPTETVREINQTIKLATSLDIDEATFSITTPLPHTHLYETSKKYIKTRIDKFDYYKTPVYTKKIAIEDKKLVQFKKKAYLMFYLSPRHLKNTIKSFITPSSLKKTLNKLKRF